MSRTNIDIDDDLIAECMRQYGLPTKRSAVELALRRLLASSDGVAAIIAAKGVGWEGDLDEMRAASGAAEL
jgi:Arc/MetJ family transcription regulator